MIKNILLLGTLITTAPTPTLAFAPKKQKHTVNPHDTITILKKCAKKRIVRYIASILVAYKQSKK